jgi:tRNA threonylcarbamoyladenosine biosynthesis protein TsaB
MADQAPPTALRLVIETAGPACSVALIDDAGQVIAASHELVGRGHAERLIPMIARLPQGGRARSILVDCGPGSFTGLRVGIAAARGLGLGWGVPVHGYSSLALLAADILAPGDEPTVSVAMPGGHGQYFIQSFAARPLRAVSAVASIMPESAGDWDNFTMAAVDRLDARLTGILDAAHVTLAPHPIYGRAPDAKPMA